MTKLKQVIQEMTDWLDTSEEYMTDRKAIRRWKLMLMESEIWREDMSKPLSDLFGKDENV